MCFCSYLELTQRAIPDHHPSQWLALYGYLQFSSCQNFRPCLFIVCLFFGCFEGDEKVGLKIKMWRGDFCNFLACSLFLEPNSCRILHHKTVHQHCNLIVLTIVYMVCIHAVSIHAMAMAPRHTITYDYSTTLHA